MSASSGLLFVRSRESAARRAGQERHIVTCEYPPQVGGVADYTAALARELVQRGERVHVWTMSAEGSRPSDAGIVVHETGRYSRHDLRRVDRALDTFPGPRRLFVQWVPHGYGYRSLNVPFCRWVYRRASTHGDNVEVMIHEPFLSFDAARLRQSGAAAVHRLMLAMLCAAARRVWTSTESYGRLVRPYGLGRDLGYGWLPVASPIARVDDVEGLSQLRARLNAAGPVVGHFGTYNALITPALRRVLVELLRGAAGQRVLLLGRGGREFAASLVTEHPGLRDRVIAPGILPPDRISLHLQACDAFVQPYPDGVCSRRTTMMALLAHGRAVATTAGERTEPWWLSTGAVRLAHDDRQLAAEVLALLSDHAARRDCEVRALELYEARCTIGRAVDLLLQPAAA